MIFLVKFLDFLFLFLFVDKDCLELVYELLVVKAFAGLERDLLELAEIRLAQVEQIIVDFLSAAEFCRFGLHFLRIFRILIDEIFLDLFHQQELGLQLRYSVVLLVKILLQLSIPFLDNLRRRLSCIIQQ